MTGVPPAAVHDTTRSNPNGPDRFPCPRCSALPGQKCRNYLGRACAPHHDRGKDPKVKPTPAASPGLFDAVPDTPDEVPAAKAYCSWCGDPCRLGRTTCDEFCARMEERVANPPVVFPGNQDISWEDDQP